MSGPFPAPALTFTNVSYSLIGEFPKLPHQANSKTHISLVLTDVGPLFNTVNP